MSGSAARRLGWIALSLGVLAPFAGSPYSGAHASIDVARLASDVAAERDHVTALELAQWIKDGKPGLRVIDVRATPDFKEYTIPGAENIPMESIASAAFHPGDTIVMFSDGGAHAAQAWVLLRALGLQKVYFLRGGLNEWIDTIVSPTQPNELSRYFGGIPRAAGTPPPTPSALRRRGC